jgi:hypothetical protein
MDARFCEAMERALAAERAKPEAEAELSQPPAVHASVGMTKGGDDQKILAEAASCTMLSER